MPEVKKSVKTIEVNYICDACGHGMMEQRGEIDPASGDHPHACVICGHQQSFKLTYPRILYVEEEEGTQGCA